MQTRDAELDEKIKACTEKVKQLAEEENKFKGERLEYDKVLFTLKFELFLNKKHSPASSTKKSKLTRCESLKVFAVLRSAPLSIRKHLAVHDYSWFDI